MPRNEPYLLRLPYGPPSDDDPQFDHYRLDTAQNDGMDLFRKLWRRKMLIISMALVGALLAAVAGFMMTPRYTAESRVLLGVEMPNVADIPSLLRELTADQDVVQSQGYVLTSRSIGAQVAHRLALDQNPEFNPALREPPAWRAFYSGAKSWATDMVKDVLRAVGLVEPSQPSPPISEEERDRRREEMVVGQLLARLDVVPLQRSHVLSISAQSENPQMAARIANTVANTYIEQQMIRRTRVTQEASEWLDQRIAQLREDVENAERATEEYRREHGLYEVRDDQVIEQQLAELNTQLIAAESQQASAEARLMQVEQVERDQKPVESLPAVVNSPLIQALVQRQVEARRQAAELSTTLGPQHPRMLDTKSQLADIKEQIDAEVTKVIQALRHEVQATRQRVESLQGNMERLQSRLGQSNQETIRLRELERQAEANRRLLVTFLDRAKETEVQPNMSEQSSVVISGAAVPLGPSYPPTTMLRMLGFIGGALIGMLIALFRENLDRTFRTTRQVEDVTNLPILGVLPSSDQAFREDAGAVDRPATPFGQAMSNLSERLVFGPGAQPHKVVMLTSATPDEGKSEIALALARLASRKGSRAVILDCDWRRPSVNHYFARPSGPGLGELLAGEASPDDVVYRDPRTGAHAIFAGDFSRLPNSRERFGLLRLLLTTLTQHYDIVIVDTAPVMVGPDALILASMVDEVEFVIRWGTNPRDVVIDAIRHLTASGAQFGGIILSEVDLKQYRQYGMGDVYYHYPMRRAWRAA